MLQNTYAQLYSVQRSGQSRVSVQHDSYSTMELRLLIYFKFQRLILKANTYSSVIRTNVIHSSCNLGAEWNLYSVIRTTNRRLFFPQNTYSHLSCKKLPSLSSKYLQQRSLKLTFPDQFVRKNNPNKLYHDLNTHTNPIRSLSSQQSCARKIRPQSYSFIVSHK